MALESNLTGIKGSSKISDKNCDWTDNKRQHTSDRTVDRVNKSIKSLNTKDSVVSVKSSVLKSDKAGLSKHIGGLIGGTNDSITKDLLGYLDNSGKITSTVDINKLMKGKVTDDILGIIGGSGIPLKTKSMFNSMLGILCDANGLDFNLDLSLLLKGLNLDALMDLFNCLGDEDTIAGKAADMMGMDMDPIVKSKALNTVMKGGKVSAKNGAKILGKQTTKDGVKQGIVDIKPFSVDAKVNNKNFSRTDKQNYMFDLEENAGSEIYNRHGSSNTTVGNITRDINSNKSRLTDVEALTAETKMLIKSRLTR